LRGEHKKSRLTENVVLPASRMESKPKGLAHF